MFEQVAGERYHDFPSIKSLAGDDVEATLREMGFGYRAAYIVKTAKHISEQHSSRYLYDLRSESYDHARSELMKLHGVGAKVSVICAQFYANVYQYYCGFLGTVENHGKK